MVKEYFIAPNFTTRPSPHGPIKLGTIMGNLHEFHPFNQRQVPPIPTSQLNPVDTQDSVDIDLLDLHSDHQNFTTRALELLGRGPRAHTQRPEGDHMIISCKHLDTISFNPTESYIKETLENLDDESHMPSSRSKRPVYMVTGLKIARDASYSSRTSKRVAAGRDFVLPRNRLVSLAISIGYYSNMIIESRWEKSEAFIVAFKVTQIWLDRKGEVKYKVYNKSAVMEDTMPSGDGAALSLPSDSNPTPQ
ncbi:hypothetical protein FGADI_2027 [Fusarium gaditjirri]|uniref:Uncharacterized protein n=1 Tax=Fusarium gaditjirri TaxID=282569 RepID=A0A8H4TJ26_9HYPO|nr:hypothetical protein FGADI_2027 [Fusarium gaditjirri]